ncbi:MAG: PfkB family carbohydrate kinase [Planctomycetota bacterium]
MKIEQVKEILDRIKNVTIAVYGDFCLDAYWMLDPAGSEVSVETGLKGQAVRKHYYTLGGASNIIANIAALKPAAIKAVGVIGPDIFGCELLRQFRQLGVDTSGLVIQQENFDTVTFAKRYLGDQEQSRIDFGFRSKRSTGTDDAVIANLEQAIRCCDATIFNQQVPDSIPNESFITRANALFKKYNDKIILLDSRHYGHMFSHVYRKTNDLEAARLNNIEAGPDAVFTLSDIKSFAGSLFEKSRKPVFVTRGHRGIIAVDKDTCIEVPGIQLLKKLDTVGAGDTTVSALALSLAAGASPQAAAHFANFAAAVTVQKLFQTGTACPQEVLEIATDPDYIYQPELAADIRQARYIQGTQIELCAEAIPTGKIKHAVFDHDGTISTLRQGWEQIMAPMMIKAVLGDQYKSADETLYHKVRNRILDYIDKSTGIQTILQMEALVEMVREFAIVPPAKILDKFGYKEIYNNELLALVNRRIGKFKNGELDLTDYTIKGAVDFLKNLKNRGVRLYLASGTDINDVIDEATALGYADLFEGRIYGAVGDITKYSKKQVINRIMTENNLSGDQLAVFGDGPVEIRQCRKHDGIAVAIASDEIRRHGLNLDKRTRLITAGAHLIVPDFSQQAQLLKFLFQK